MMCIPHPVLDTGPLDTGFFSIKCYSLYLMRFIYLYPSHPSQDMLARDDTKSMDWKLGWRQKGDTMLTRFAALRVRLRTTVGLTQVKDFVER